MKKGSGRSPGDKRLTPAKRDWRGAGGRDTDSPRAGVRRIDSQRKKTRQYFKVLGWLSGTLLLAALFIAWVLNQKRPTPIFVLAQSGYPVALPPNSFALEDAKLWLSLEDSAGGGMGRTGWLPHSLEWSDRQLGDVTDYLEKHFESSWFGLARPPSSLVLWMSGHGTIDEHSGPCLLLGDSEAYLPSRKIVLAEVLRELASVKPEIPKLVILDADRLGPSWVVGTAEHSFSEALAELFDQDAPDFKNVYVLNSAAPGEMAWTAPELGATPFAYFTAKGFSGEADSDGDGELTFAELVPYVQSQVAGWILSHRRAGQHPTPYFFQPEQEDGNATTLPSIRLASVGKGFDIETTPIDWNAQFPAKRRRLLAESAGLWEWHRQLMSDRAYELQPLRYAYLQHLLIRLEQLHFAGEEFHRRYPQAFEGLLKQLTAPGMQQSFLQRGSDFPPLTQPLADRTSPENKSLDDVWEPLIHAENPQEIRHALERIAATPNDLAQPPQVEVLFGRMLLHHLIWDELSENQLWNLSQLVRIACHNRLLTEAIAFPGDVRAVDWAQIALERPEPSRRSLEDRVFVPKLDQAELTQQMQTLNADLQRLRPEVTRIADAFHLRDEMLAHLPYLSDWIARQLSALPQDSARGELRGSLQTMAERTQKLLRSLQQWSGELVSHRGDFGGDLTAVDSDLQDWRQLVDDFRELVLDIDTQLGEATSETAAKDAWFALLNPLVTGSQRSRLRTALENTWQANQASTGSTSAIPELVQSLTNHGANEYWRTTADLMLGVSNGPVPPEQLLQLGTSFRVPGNEVSRKELDQQEAMLRAHACALAIPWRAYFMRRTAEDDTEPASRLYRWDAARQNAWFARRFTDDFWGADPLAVQSDDAYFSVAAQQFIDAIPDSVRRHFPQLASDLSARREAAQRGIVFKNEQGSRTLPRRATGLHPVVADAMPVGAAVARLGPNDSFLPQNEEEIAITVPVGEGTDDQTNYELAYVGPTTDDAAHEETVLVNTFYRGHQYETRLTVPGVEPGLVTTWQQPTYVAPTVVVRGDKTEAPYVMFIVDCSATMGEPFSSAEGTRSRLLAAVSELENAVEELGNGEFHVNLMLMGHRMGIDEKQDPQPSLYTPPFPQQSIAPEHPDEDVQHLGTWMPMGIGFKTIVQDLAQDASTQTPRLRPWGLTPIYYALKTTLEEMETLPADVPKQIVLITDGVNNQLGGSKSQALTKLSAVQELLDRPTAKNVQVDVLMIGEQEAVKSKDSQGNWRIDPNNQRKLADLIALARSSQPSQEDSGYHRTDDSGSLAAALRDLVKPKRFGVVARNSSQSEAVRPLNVPLVLDLEGPVVEPQEYQVRIVSAENVSTAVSVTGREAIEIDYQRGRLEFARYGFNLGDIRVQAADQGQSNRENVSNPWYEFHQEQGDANLVRHGPQKLWIAAHEPEVRHDAEDTSPVDFFVSIQNQNEREFSPRPAHVWAYIRPIAERGQMSGYHFVDTDFVAHVSAPLLRFTVEKWSRNWRQAEIHLWITYERELEPTRLGVGQLRSLEESEGRVLDVPAPAGKRINVTGKSATGGDFAIRVQYETSGNRIIPEFAIYLTPSAKLIQRAFYVDTNAWKHTFVFPYETPGAKYLQVVHRDRLLRHAVRITNQDGGQPLVVRVGFER